MRKISVVVLLVVLMMLSSTFVSAEVKKERVSIESESTGKVQTIKLDNYTIEAGESLIINDTDKYMDVELIISVKSGETVTSAPKTGDASPLLLLTAMLAVSAIGLMVLFRAKKLKKAAALILTAAIVLTGFVSVPGMTNALDFGKTKAHIEFSEDMLGCFKFGDVLSTSGGTITKTEKDGETVGLTWSLGNAAKNSTHKLSYRLYLKNSISDNILDKTIFVSGKLILSLDNDTKQMAIPKASIVLIDASLFELATDRAVVMDGYETVKMCASGEFPYDYLKVYGGVTGGEYVRYFQNDTNTVIENDYFTMTIPAGVPYIYDIEQRILSYMKMVEEASGLSFYPDSSFPKVVIEVNDSGGAWGGYDGISVADFDLLDMMIPGMEFVFLHELTHVLEFRAIDINSMSIPFTEGFAIINSLNAAKKNGLKALENHIPFNYYWLDNPSIMDGDMETFFRTGNDWDAYLVGYRFGIYLEKEYGTGKMAEITKAYGQSLAGAQGTSDKFVDFLKTYLGQTIFDDFSDWYADNSSIFDVNTSDTRRTDNYINSTFPLIFEDRLFNEVYQFDTQKEVVLDLRDANIRAQKLGYTTAGLYGSMYEGEATIAAYDKDGKFIGVKEMKLGDSFGFAGAAILILKGSGKFGIELNVDLSFVK